MPHDLLCLSHLRWNFVFQRPQHLMTRFAAERRVFYVEEPVFDGGPRLELSRPVPGLTLVVPHLDAGAAADAAAQQRVLIDELVADQRIAAPVLWYYTPMALPFSRHLASRAVIYDCMDELSAFRFAPPELLLLERELLRRADVVFTGGRSLHEAKRDHHRNVHAFPSSVDVAHFAAARAPLPDPEAQRPIARPRVGWFGVIDERMDLELVDELARRRPDWQLVLVGPVVKIDPASLPRLPNVHFLGQRSYRELPAFIAGWDVAIMPFARNEATRYISPTKTPEYLAAGRPVVSTSIRDVVTPYGDLGLARIADSAEAFERAVEASLREDLTDLRARADRALARSSWDQTYADMRDIVDDLVHPGRRDVPAVAAASIMPT
jgi:UDP-galactopyranose mutase